MKRLTISVHACTETLALLIAVAWADGRLDDKEREGVRGAAQALNLNKDLRDRLEQLIEKPAKVSELSLDALSPRDRAFAYVASAWMAHADGTLDPDEQALLDELGKALDFDEKRQAELMAIAEKLEPRADGERSWADEISRLFKRIPPAIEEPGGEFDVAFE
ncbi:MAG: DUF533 domain-containing protein [Byssovorax sp.]